MLTRYKTVLAVIAICAIIIGLSSFTTQTPGPQPAKPMKWDNLKVLPKNLTHDELMNIMHGYCKALNVHCGECHAKAAGSTDEKPQMDFSSDANPKKNTARDMIKMVNAINSKYLSKIDGGMLEQVNCVTCHNGHTKPMVNVDSLPKMQMMH